MSLKNFNRTDDIFSLCGLNCGLSEREKAAFITKQLKALADRDSEKRH
jgi:hypothetical protein